jgi:3-oxoadipate enol-lactonase
MAGLSNAVLVAIFLLASACGWCQSESHSSPKSSPPEPGTFVEVDGGKIFYEECGTAPQTVVLIHDGIAHSAVWDDVWPIFCKRFHTIRFDRRGYGRSPVATGPYTETDDMAALFHHLKVAHAILVGSSHGGQLSIDFTLQYPNVVQQLILVGAVVDGLPYSDHFINRGISNSAPFEKNNIAAGVSNWANDKYVMAPDHVAAKERLRALLMANPQDLTHTDYVRPVKPELPRLHEIHVPTLILVGDADIPDVHAHAGAIEAGIAGARRVVLSDVGHLMYMEKPAEFSQQVISFIDLNSD